MKHLGISHHERHVVTISLNSFGNKRFLVFSVDPSTYYGNQLAIFSLIVYKHHNKLISNNKNIISLKTALSA